MGSGGYTGGPYGEGGDYVVYKRQKMIWFDVKIIIIVVGSGGYTGGPYGEGGDYVHKVRGAATSGAILHSILQSKAFAQCRRGRQRRWGTEQSRKQVLFFELLYVAETK